jgi:hypothetical protein
LRYKDDMLRYAFAGLMLLCAAAKAAPSHQDWVVTHQPDRFVDRMLMQAWADADTGPARMEIYCDTDSGFRVMFLPHRALIPEGPSQVSLTIDNTKPVVLRADAFGDDDTDVVTVYDTEKIESALATAHHIVAHFLGAGDKSGEDDFTFGNLAAQRDTLMKVCPLR